jgi:hypothetical protein
VLQGPFQVSLDILIVQKEQFFRARTENLSRTHGEQHFPSHVDVNQAVPWIEDQYGIG